jgi:hypothetical protein
MHQDMICPGIRERRDERIDRLDHQVHVKRQTAMWTQALQDGRTEADVRDEVAVHDVKMQPVGSRGLDRCNFLVQTREIRSQQARRYSDSPRS